MVTRRITVPLTVAALLMQLTAGRAAASPLPQCTPGYHAEYVSTTPSTMPIQTTPGTTLTVTVRIRNLGCVTWEKGTANEARLGTWNPEPGQDASSDLCVTGAGSGWLGCNRVPQTTAAVAYDAVADFTFNVRGPVINNVYAEGIYTLYLRPVVDGVTWMENLGMWVQVRVGNYYGVKNTSFKKPGGTPILTQQATCVYCVPAATTAWISYVWITVNGNDSGHVFTHQDFWDNYFNAVTRTNSRNLTTDPWTASDPSVLSSNCSTDLGGNFSYPKRSINSSSDAGVDPYGAAWGIFDYTPGGYYYHMHTYSGSSFALGRDYATRAIALTMSRFNEPMGVLVDNGGHYVLGTGVTADRDPQADFWNAVITNIYIRDPIRPLATQLRVFVNNQGEWNATFTPYGYSGETAMTHPKACTTTSCIDDARRGYGTYTLNTATPSLWWGKFVTVERAISTQTQSPDTAVQHVR